MQKPSPRLTGSKINHGMKKTWPLQKWPLTGQSLVSVTISVLDGYPSDLFSASLDKVDNLLIFYQAAKGLGG